MTRLVSFAVLVVILVWAAILFFRVLGNFILPMFVALVLVVVFRPLHRRVRATCGGRDRLAAGLTTGAILLIVLLPLLFLLLQAASEAIAIGFVRNVGDGKNAAQDGLTRPHGEAPPPAGPSFAKELADGLAAVTARAGMRFSSEDLERMIHRKLEEWIGPVVRFTAQLAGNFLLGLVVMLVSLYFFLADGPSMIKAVKRLVPLEEEHQDRIIAEFDRTCRAVISAILAAAVVQGLLAGLGFYLAGVDTAFLLALLTMVFALIPFVGATCVWLPVSLWLLLYEGRTGTAVFLAVYGGGIVSTIDNVIKPLILHGQASLHPLLAFLSVLGGVQAFGPIGLFVGPMVVAFLHTVLKIVHLELGRMDLKPLKL